MPKIAKFQPKLKICKSEPNWLSFSVVLLLCGLLCPFTLNPFQFNLEFGTTH